jgi:competence protein ComEA
MRKSLKALVLTLIVAAIASTSYAAEPVAGASNAPAPASAGVVNINTADATQLALLPRVGEKSAQRIIEYRGAHGGFKKTSDLMQVKGIGAKTFERLSSYITVEGKTTLTSDVRSPRKPRTKKSATP